MKKHIFVLGVLSLIFTAGAQTNAPAGFDPFHETKAEYNARVQWLRDAKFGVFVHWNPSALTGKEISLSVMTGQYPRAQYDQLYKQFKGEKFNADEWVKLFHESGIRYAVIVPKHHDGFCMWDSKVPSCAGYTVMNTPFGRDYLQEISQACHRDGVVRFCLYYSIADFWNPKYRSAAGADMTAYKNDVFKPHLKELLTLYGPVGYIWFDGNWDPSWTFADAREIYAYCRRLQPNALISQHLSPRSTKFPNPMWSVDASNFVNEDPDGKRLCDFQSCENDPRQLNKQDLAWDVCSPLANGYACVLPANPKPASWVIGNIIRNAGLDGSFLLGVGPRPDGTIAPSHAAVLLEVGEWLKLNGEAVYGTRGGPWLPGAWGVSTRKGDKVFLFVQKWKGDALTLRTLPAEVKSARVLTGGTAVLDGWTLRVSAEFHRPIATIIELTLDQDAMKLPVIAVPEPRNLARGKPVEVSSVWPGREKELAPAYITDGKEQTIWAAEEKARDAWVTVDLQKACEVSEAMLSDAPYGRTQSFDLEGQVAGEWKKLAAGKTIGNELRLTFAPVKARLFRLNIRQASDTPTLAEFQLFGKP
jgi:alpha-L-fucosidase